MKRIALIVSLAFMCSLVALAEQNKSDDNKTEVKPVPPVLNFTMKSLDGRDVPLSEYQGKVIILVNTASKCGKTPQYKALQALYDKHQEKGLVVLGFPANDFGKQEPGTDEEIASFCEKNYGVTFPMFSKISVKGQEIAPLYKFLTDPQTNEKFAGEIKWNFTKFIIGRDGQVIARFEPNTKPDAEEFVKVIEAELEKVGG